MNITVAEVNPVPNTAESATVPPPNPAPNPGKVIKCFAVYVQLIIKKFNMQSIQLY